ncbi:MAG: PorP/SprF family type IX secretion system membrane protein [Cyclobacteriaceae bacterium]
MKKLFPLFIALVLNVFTVSSQTLPHVYNQFFMNPYIYNPAYAGVEGHAVIFAMYKTQWSGIDGGPQVAHVNFHVPLKGGLSFGTFAYNQSTGPLTTSGGKITAGYLITLDREHFFRFGLSIGAGNTMLDRTIIDSPNDVAFADLPQAGSFLLGDVGFTYHFGHFNVGVALPSLFSSTIPHNSGFELTAPKPTDNILFKTNYRGHINDDIAIEPHLIYRYNKYHANQYEATVIFHIYHLVWVGGSYRQGGTTVGLLGAKVKEKMGIGYSYEFGNPNYGGLLGNSHEIHIGYHIGSKKEHAEHVSSFIKSHRLDAEQRAKQAELERQRKLQELRESRAAAQAKESEDELGILGAPAEEKPEEKPKNTWNYEQEEKLVERVNEFGETEKGIKFDRINENGEKEVVFSWLPPPPPGAKSETYRIANPEEPPLERIAADGSKEVGVKWIRVIDGGQKEVLVVWDPILTETEADQIDHSPSQTLGLGAANIVITNTPPTPVPTPEVEVVPEVPVDETPIVETVEEPVQEVEQIVEEEPIVNEPVVEEAVEEAPVQDERTHEELANSNEHLEVKRGGNMLELPAGNYVVAGAFSSFQHAQDLSDKMFERGFHDTRVGYLSERGYYYVTIYQSNDLKSANIQRNKVKGRSGMSKVWVLKVSE